MIPSPPQQQEQDDEAFDFTMNAYADCPSDGSGEELRKAHENIE